MSDDELIGSDEEADECSRGCQDRKHHNSNSHLSELDRYYNPACPYIPNNLSQDFLTFLWVVTVEYEYLFYAQNGVSALFSFTQAPIYIECGWPLPLLS